MKRLVLVGGGHSHVEVLLRFGLQPLDDVEITLISPGRFTPYSGMLPGLVAGHYTFEQAHIDLEPLARVAHASFLRDLVVGLDAGRKLLRCDSGASVPYDVVSLDIGAAPTRDFQRPPEASGIPVRPVERYLAAWDDVMRQAAQRPMDLVTIGGGAGGVEITLAMQHRLKQVAPGQPVRFAIVTMTDAILAGHANSVRKRLQRVLAQRDIAVHPRSRVVGLEGRELLLESGRRLHADRAFWAIGPQASEWLAEAALRTDQTGFVLVNDLLQSLSHPDVFAAGDIATMARHRRPKSGVYAVRQGPALANNLRRTLAGRALEPYFPQPIALYLISTGDQYAVASWGPFSLEGTWVWRWKDRIDRRFVERYRLG